MKKLNPTVSRVAGPHTQPFTKTLTKNTLGSERIKRVDITHAPRGISALVSHFKIHNLQFIFFLILMLDSYFKQIAFLHVSLFFSIRVETNWVLIDNHF